MDPFYVELLHAFGSETGDANQYVYLGTVSRVLPAAAAAGGYRDIAGLTKGELLTIVRGSFDDPVGVSGSRGRPRKRDGSPVDLVVVVKEKHSDGTPHFHFVVKLLWNMRFKQAKATMRERHALPSHWSCTHSKLYTALRYVAVATPKKPDILAPPRVKKGS